MHSTDAMSIKQWQQLIAQRRVDLIRVGVVRAEGLDIC
jgi:hypothetical protein